MKQPTYRDLIASRAKLGDKAYHTIPAGEPGKRFFFAIGRRSIVAWKNIDEFTAGKRRSTRTKLCDVASAADVDLAFRKAKTFNPARVERSDLTLRMVADDYSLSKRLEERPRTLENLKLALKNNPWADVPLVKVPPRDEVLKWFLNDPRKPTINRTVTWSRTLWKHAAEHLAKSDLAHLSCPYKGFSLHDEDPERPALEPHEIGPWFKVVRALPINRRALQECTLRLGWRSSELRNLRWEDVDPDNAVAVVRSPKGGPSRAFKCPLPRQVVDLLRTVPRTSEWVFHSPESADGRIKDVRQKVRDPVTGKKRAGLATGHALRRTYASAHEAILTPDKITKLLMNHKLPKGDVTEDAYRKNAWRAGALAEAAQRVNDHLDNIGEL